MEWRNLFEKSSEIPKKYQEAFKTLGNELIFTEKFDLNIDKNNAIKVSQEIQDEFLQFDARLSENRLTWIKEAMGRFNEEGEIGKAFIQGLSKEKEKLPILAAKNVDLSPKEYLDVMCSIFFLNKEGYYGWGFTPKLAEGTKDRKTALNCFGIASLMGSYSKSRGLKTEMGLTPDHPYAIVQLEDGVYAVDGHLPNRKLNGTIEDKGSYKIYRSVPEDNMLSKFMLIYDFDKAVLHEVLENMEVLRQISLGAKGITLPNTFSEGKMIALAHQDTLQKIDWKDLQQKLFPEIQKSFEDNKNEWSDEVERYKKERQISHAETVFEKAIEKAVAGSPDRKDDKEGQSSLVLEAGKYKDEIRGFLREGKAFSESVPEYLKDFFTSIKREVSKDREEWTPEMVYDIVEKKLFDKKPK